MDGYVIWKIEWTNRRSGITYVSKASAPPEEEGELVRVYALYAAVSTLDAALLLAAAAGIRAEGGEVIAHDMNGSEYILAELKPDMTDGGSVSIRKPWFGEPSRHGMRWIPSRTISCREWQE